MTSPDLAAAVERLESALRTDAAARFVDASVDPKDLRLLIADWRARGEALTKGRGAIVATQPSSTTATGEAHMRSYHKAIIHAFDKAITYLTP